MAALGGEPSPQIVEKATRTIPIVFVQVIEPVGSGFVESLARPGGKFEYSLAGKWVELLKQIAPHVTRAAVIRDPTRGPGIGQFAVVQAIAPSLGMELKPINLLDVSETERTIAAFARSPNGGLIVTVGGTAFNRDLIIALAAKHRLPAVYPYRYFASAGSLMSYGPDTIEHHRRAAGYVDAGAGADQVRACDQSKDRQGPRPLRTAVRARARRRSHRIADEPRLR
ncbi:MAG: ABC transporter substrate-binding protein [Pseudolabrys sp.]